MNRPKVGFTGTRFGMTCNQQELFGSLLASFNPVEFHHGDCIGSDDQAANIAHKLKVPVFKHPPLDTSLQANNPFSTKTFPAKTHFARNRDIVDSTSILVAAPYTMERQSFGGTWYTIDYAKKKQKTVFIIWPDGKVTKFEEGWEYDYIT